MSAGALRRPEIAPERVVQKSFDVLREWADRVIDELPTYADERIFEVCAQAGELERQAFRIRGKGALIIRDRVAQRLSGGRGRVDTEGVGVQAQLRIFADRVGVDVSTVSTDARLVEVFGDSETFAGDAETLGREMLREALAAPDPHKAVALARTKREKIGSSYTVKQFREDVRSLAQAHRREEAEPQLEDVFYYTLAFDRPASDLLARVRGRRRGRESQVAEVVKVALAFLDDFEKQHGTLDSASTGESRT